jgi:hypothetical protein
VEDHLASIADPLARSLAGSGIAYLRLAADSLLRRVGPPRYVVPATGSALPVLLPDESSFACDAAIADDRPPGKPLQ